VASFDKKSLKVLKKQLAKQQKEELEKDQQAQQKQREQENDNNAFHEAMSGVTPLSVNNVVHEKVKPTAKRLQHDDLENEFTINDTLSDELEIADIEGEAILSFCRSGIQHIR